MRYAECPGTYILHHKPTGKFYIGCSSKIRRRLYIHKHHLINGRHSCKELQAVFTKWDDLEIQAYYFNTPTEAAVFEERLLGIYVGWTNCCNKYRTKESLIDHESRSTIMRSSGTGRKHSEESKRKMAVNSSKRVIIDGTMYQSVKIAAETLGIPRHTIHSRIRRKAKGYENWYYP